MVADATGVSSFVPRGSLAAGGLPGEGLASASRRAPVGSAEEGRGNLESASAF